MRTPRALALVEKHITYTRWYFAADCCLLFGAAQTYSKENRFLFFRGGEGAKLSLDILLFFSH